LHLLFSHMLCSGKPESQLVRSYLKISVNRLYARDFWTSAQTQILGCKCTPRLLCYTAVERMLTTCKGTTIKQVCYTVHLHIDCTTYKGVALFFKKIWRLSQVWWYTPTAQAEAGGSSVWGEPGLHSKFKTTLGYIVRLCPPKTNNPPNKHINKQNPPVTHFEALVSAICVPYYNIFYCSNLLKFRHFSNLANFSALQSLSPIFWGFTKCFPSDPRPLVWCIFPSVWGFSCLWLVN
jgi:hypothetical protein